MNHSLLIDQAKVTGQLPLKRPVFEWEFPMLIRRMVHRLPWLTLVGITTQAHGALLIRRVMWQNGLKLLFRTIQEL